MVKLVVLCVDGLGFELVQRFKTNLPFESKLTIPRELYLGEQPFTPDIWASMFTGKIINHPDKFKRDKGFFHDTRIKIRDWLKKHGISWHRKGLKITRNNSIHENNIKDATPSYIHWKKCVNKSIFDNYDSFLFNIPSITDSFFFGGLESDKEFYNVFKILAMELWRYNYHIGAIYTHYLDLKAHYTNDPNDLKILYNEVKNLADYNINKDVDVIVVSDHSCLGKHGDHAYLGTSFPHQADNILEINKIIKKFMDNKRKNQK